MTSEERTKRNIAAGEAPSGTGAIDFRTDAVEAFLEPKAAPTTEAITKAAREFEELEPKVTPNWKPGYLHNPNPELTKEDRDAMIADMDEALRLEEIDNTACYEPSALDQDIVDSKLAAYVRREELEAFQKEVLAAFKHLGLDVRKHFKS